MTYKEKKIGKSSLIAVRYDSEVHQIPVINLIVQNGDKPPRLLTIAANEFKILKRSRMEGLPQCIVFVSTINVFTMTEIYNPIAELNRKIVKLQTHIYQHLSLAIAEY